MQSFASHPTTPTPIPHPHKNHAPQIKHHKFMPHPHKKGATIAYTYALSTQKSIERAQLSPIPQEKFVKICANSWLKTTNTGSTNHTDFLLNLLNPCEPKKHHKSEIRVGLKCPPASVRFPTIKSKTCEICGIRVSPNPTHKSEIRVSQAAHAHKSGDSCEEKRIRGWGGYHFLRSLSLKKTIAISYGFFVLMINTKAAAITR